MENAFPLEWLAAGFAVFAGGVSDFPRLYIFFIVSRRFFSCSRFAALISSSFNLSKAYPKRVVAKFCNDSNIGSQTVTAKFNPSAERLLLNT